MSLEKRQRAQLDNNYNTWMGQQGQQGVWGYTPGAADYLKEPGFANYIQQYNPALYEQMSGVDIDGLRSDSLLGQGVAENFKSFMRGPQKKSQAEFRPSHLVSTQPNIQQRKEAATRINIPDVYNNPQTTGMRGYLHGEQQRVNKLPFASYQGDRLVPESMLTKRARELENTQSLPYSNEMDLLRGRQKNNQGLYAQDRQSINDFLKQHEGKYQDKTVKFLQRNFRKPYEQADQDRFIKTNQKRLHEGDAVKQQELNDFAQVLAATHNLADTKKIELLQKFGSMKTQDRDSLVSLLRSGGNTETAIGNMGLEAAQRNFQNQLAQPNKDVAHLEQGLAPHFAYDETKMKDTKAARDHALRRQAIIESGEQDIGPYQSEMRNVQPPNTNANEIMDFYKKRKAEGHSYPNMRAATMPDELKTTLSQIHGTELNDSPELKGEISKMIGSNEDTSGKITNSALDSIRARTSYNDKSARRLAKSRARSAGNQYAARGEYNSPAHLAEVEAIMRQANQEGNNERHSNILSSLTNQSKRQGYLDKTQMMNAQLAALKQQLANNDTFGNLENKRKQGVDRFNTTQDVLDRQYVDDIMKHDYQFANLRDAIMNKGFDNAPLNRQNFGTR